MTGERGMAQLSIIIPAFNVAPYIAEAVASALGQSTGDIEVIVVDDGSTDGTADALAALPRDPRLTLVRQDNAGPSTARNAGLGLATAPLVGFLDGDDRWHRHKAARHLALHRERPDIDLSFSAWRTIAHDGTDTGRRGHPRAGPTGFRDLLRENITGTASTVVARRAAVTAAGGFDAALRSNVDIDLWLRIVAPRPAIAWCLGEVLTDYRQRPGQIVGDWRRMAAGWEIVLTKAMALRPLEAAAIAGEARARYRRYLSYIAYRGGDYPAARELLAAAWRTAPLVLLTDRRGLLTSAAVAAASVLPDNIHGRLVAKVEAARARRAAGDD